MAQERQYVMPERLVWTGKSSTQELFFDVTGGMPAAAIKWVRPRELDLQADSGDLQLALGYQISNGEPESDWGSTTVIGSYTSTSGLTHTST